MGEVWNVTRMVISMRENSRIISLMAKVSILGSMEKYTRVNGKRGSRRAKAFGRAFLETRILASGLRVKRMGTVCISGRMVIDMRESGNSV